jgi:hypothetical protein
MIEELDRSLERWLRAAVPLAQGTAEVRFDQPERDWDARRPIPLVDLFLYSLRPSTNRAATGSWLVRQDGGLAREPVVPVFEARYFVSVWGGGPGVEHELGRIVNLLAPLRAIPEEHLGDGLRLARPRPAISLAPDDTTTSTQLWSALGIPPRAGVQLRVESPMGVPVALPAADPPRTMQLVTSDRRRPAAYSRRRRVFGSTDPAAAGGRVVSPRGSAIIEDSGRYGVEAAPDDPIEIEPPPASVERGRG